MNKGNVFGGEITPEQRARISQKFRQAKALLSRKRPSDNSSFLSPPNKLKDGNRINTYRIPLNEIDVNTPPQFPAKCSRLTYSDSIIPCPGKLYINNDNNNDDDDDCSRKILQPDSRSTNGSTITSITTPLNHKEFVENLSGASSLPAADLDDDFDEAVLKEIDALIEQKSASKTLQKTPLGHDNGSSAVTINYPESLSIEKPLGDEGVLDLGKRIEASAEQNIPPFNDNIASADTISYVESLTINKPLANEGALDLGKRTEASLQGSEVAPVLNDDRLPQAYSKYLHSLNEQQREAACSDISVPLMIVAGPGSGKTSTMVGRILMLIHEGISPSNILAMTFTTAAASEMRERIAKVAGKEPAKELTISTFHSFCLQLCRSHADKLGRSSEFLIYGHGQQRRAIIEAVRLFENKTNNGENPDVSKLDQKSSGMEHAQYFKDKSKKWQKIVTQAKASGRTPEDCRKIGDAIGATILGNYDDILRSCNALDYHDLISCAVKLLTDFQEVYDECRDLWKAIVIDEFQDTSAMQYNFLHLLASHNHITVVGDEDQSIFSFNGADISGFDSFRKDFPNHKEIRLSQNYRSTRSIVEAASSLINNNVNRCQLKKVVTDNCLGFKITVKECHNEDAQCDFIVDKILETISDNSHGKCSFGSIAILYRRQVSGKAFQRAFRSRKIPFNVHGVAFYRKKVIKAIMAMLRTTLPGCDDGPFRQSVKALLPCEKEEKKRVIDYIDKISTIRKCSFVSAAYDIFAAKISGTFKRSQLSQGYKVLFTLDMITKLVQREPSISTVITSVANMLPQKYLLEQRAVVDADGGKLLNEDNDLRCVLQYLLDDVSDFLSSHFSLSKLERDSMAEGEGCANLLKAFIDYISTRESENFRSRRRDNGDSVTLTTIHQSKGLEWDTVFIVKANETEIPLLHEFNGFVKENGTSLEEERRLLYVAMTRARKKLYILYVLMDSNWQLLQPSRFLKEIPDHLREVQGDSSRMESHNLPSDPSKVIGVSDRAPTHEQFADVSHAHNNIQAGGILSDESVELSETCNGSFLKRFSLEDRSVISHVFHQWAKKKAFENPKRLLDKIGFVIDERLRSKTTKNKDALRALKSCLKCDEAFHYAENILRWEKLPADTRAHLMREKQEYFQKLRIENAMGSSVATSKQITYLQSLGCTVVPTSRLHASHLIEQYKSL